MRKLLLTIAMAVAVLSVGAQDLRSSIERGVQTSIRQTENHQWKEAFTTCRDLDAAITNQERATKKAAPELRYIVTKERLRMYQHLNKAAQAKEQLDRLGELAAQANDANLSESFLLTKADYYQHFGKNDVAIACYKTIIDKRKSGKDEKGVDQCYKDMIAQAKASNNAPFARTIEKMYQSWQDSIKAANAEKDFLSLKNLYSDSQLTIEEKDNKLAVQTGVIVFLCILAVALAGGLLFFIFVMFKNMRQIKKLKQSLGIANDNNALKSKFISNISAQISPSLDAIEAGDMKHIVALKDMMAHTQRYMELEDSREERYEQDSMDVNAFCAAVVAKAKENISRDIPFTFDVPRISYSTNAEALQEVLLYLIESSAEDEATEKLSLDFKKRSAHSGNFIVTATGRQIPEDKRENIFKPFTEIVDLTEGDGLGLPICSLMAYKLNGTLLLDEEYRKGTRFVIELHTN